jgi:hypothetical protein
MIAKDGIGSLLEFYVLSTVPFGLLIYISRFIIQRFYQIDHKNQFLQVQGV